MKKTIKTLSVGILAIICAFSAVISVSADTYYEYFGYQYTIFNETSVSLAGWDNRTPELVIPNTIEKRDVVSIANEAFRNNTEITSVNFSNVLRLKRIGMYAFENCTSITSDIIMPDCINVLNSGAFFNCSSVPSVRFSKYITNIPQESFYSCTSLTSVTLPENLEKIGRIAFAYCTQLGYVEMPKSVTFIDDTAFYGDANLTLGVWFDSYGYQYAKDNNIPFVLLDDVMMGDVNSDGMVNVNDVTALQRHLASIETLNDLQLKAADVTADDDVSIDDVTLIQRYLAEFEDAAL